MLESINIRLSLYAIQRLFVLYLIIAQTLLFAEDKTILVLGDSISSAYGFQIDKGWVNLLRNRLNEKGQAYNVINASITGEISAGGAKRITKLLNEHAPIIVIVELGGNDGLRGLSIKQLKQNLQFIIDQCKQYSADVVLVQMKIFPNYGANYTKQFLQVYEQLAENNNLTMVPFILEEVALDRTLMQGDGVHPNEMAQPIILDKIWPYVRQVLRSHAEHGSVTN